MQERRQRRRSSRGCADECIVMPAHRAMHLAEIGPRGADWAQLAFNPIRCCVHGFGVRHIGRNWQRTRAEMSQFCRRVFKSV